ncbi:MAG: FkbM family methyltransferase [Halioglobus sp.]|jgi:FkbM family methyltransferase
MSQVISQSKGNLFQRAVAALGQAGISNKKLVKSLIGIASHSPGYEALVRKQVNSFQFDLNLDEFVQQQMYYLGAYDHKGVSLITQIARNVNCQTALDIGANIGNHAVFLGDHCAELYCFEPNDSPRNVFEGALQRAGKTNIHLLDYGLAESNETLKFFELASNLGASSFVFDEKNAGDYVEKQLKIRHGDEVVTELGITDIDFIKIDVEGFEKEVLTGLQATIAVQQPVIDFEYHADTREKFGSMAALQAVLPGYTLYGARRAIKAIDEYRNLYGHGSLLKSALTTRKALLPFHFEQKYAHVVAVPQRFPQLIYTLESD